MRSPRQVRQQVNGAGVPVAVAAVALANSIMQVVVTFGVDLTASQQTAISGVVNALLVSGASILYALREVRRPPPEG